MIPFANAAVAKVFAAYSPRVRPKLLALRELIFRTATRTRGVGTLQETLKWGQPSYLTVNPKSGSTVRLDAISTKPGEYALYVHCQTTLLANFKETYGDTFRYEGNRALLFSFDTAVPTTALSHCIALALTYHLKKHPTRLPVGTQIR